jgi:NADH-quinone oxidoreductase subunit N
MFVFLLSLTGIPLTGGFIGKFYVFGAAVQHRYFFLVGVAAINAGIAAFYYLNVVRAMFFPSQEEDVTIERVEEVAEAEQIPVPRLGAPLGVQVVVLICLVVTLWLGIYPPNVIGWANSASQQLLTFGF